MEWWLKKLLTSMFTLRQVQHRETGGSTVVGGKLRNRRLHARKGQEATRKCQQVAKGVQGKDSRRLHPWSVMVFTCDSRDAPTTV